MLLMPGDKKKMASLIVAKIKPDYVGEKEGGYDKKFEEKDEEEEVNYGVVACCEKVIECMKKGDAKSMASYMEDLFEMMQGTKETY